MQRRGSRPAANTNIKVRRPGCGRLRLVLLGTAALICYLLFLVEQRVRPVMMAVAEYECQEMSILAINRAVTQAIGQNPAGYRDIYEVRTDQNGRITSVVANAAAVNAVKAELTHAVSTELSALSTREVTIPIGTLVGWQLLAGMGPEMRVRVLQESYVDSDLTSRLQTSGINQTELLVFMRFHVTMGVMLSGFSSSVEVQDEVCIAQALVVGDVPQFFVQSTGQT